MGNRSNDWPRITRDEARVNEITLRSVLSPPPGLAHSHTRVKRQGGPPKRGRKRESTDRERGGCSFTSLAEREREEERPCSLTQALRS